MRISDWRSDVCSSDLRRRRRAAGGGDTARGAFAARPVLSGPMARRGDWRRGRNIIASPTTVVAGLDPAIHFATRRGLCKRRKWILVSSTRMTEEWVEPPLSRAPLALAAALQDRKSVVSGHGVSLRLDLGCRLIIKKTK